jgi:hypothetical protein
MRWFCKACLWCNIAMGLIAGIALLSAAPAMATDDAMMRRMEKIIQKQQEQIEAQAKAIKKLQEQVDMITEKAPKVIEKLEREIDTGTEKAVKQAKEAARTEVRKISRHGDTVSHEFDDKLRLDLYGWINKAFMVSDDGDSTDYYVVDPGTATSRIGALGSFKVNDGFTFFSV